MPVPTEANASPFTAVPRNDGCHVTVGGGQGCTDGARHARCQPGQHNAVATPNSRFLVVDGEADEVPVVRGPVPVPRDNNAVLPRAGGREVQDVALTWSRGTCVSDTPQRPSPPWA